MFVPPHYRAPVGAQLDLIRRHPLALLVSVGGGQPLATHLPVIPVAGTLPDDDAETGLAGAEFVGHMNRMNPHWESLRDSRALLVCQGPEAYVSPVVYGTSPAAPTWNFTAVHLHGTASKVEDDAERMRILQETVLTYERDHGGGWDMTDSLGYFEQIVAGVGAFRFAVTASEAMFKLSQDKPRAVQQQVRDAFEHGPAGRTHEVAQAMSRYGRGVCGREA